MALDFDRCISVLVPNPVTWMPHTCTLNSPQHIVLSIMSSQECGEASITRTIHENLEILRKFKATVIDTERFPSLRNSHTDTALPSPSRNRNSSPSQFEDMVAICVWHNKYTRHMRPYSSSENRESRTSRLFLFHSPLASTALCGSTGQGPNLPRQVFSYLFSYFLTSP